MEEMRINYITHKYGPSPYSNTETEKFATPDEAIEYILKDMVCDNRLTLKQIEDYTLDEVYDCVMRECISKILEYNELDLEESANECKEFLADHYTVIALNENLKTGIFKIIDEMSMERRNKKNDVKKEPELKLTKNGIPDKRTAAGKQWYAKRAES
jgi:hypothetical protein